MNRLKCDSPSHSAGARDLALSLKAFALKFFSHRNLLDSARPIDLYIRRGDSGKA